MQSLLVWIVEEIDHFVLHHYFYKVCEWTAAQMEKDAEQLKRRIEQLDKTSNDLKNV